MAAVTGNVMRDGTAEPLAGVVVRATSADGVIVATATTDASGHYQLSVDEGSYLFRIEAGPESFALWHGDKFAPQHSTLVDVDAANGAAVDFTVPQAATLTGRTTNARGLPVRLTTFSHVLEDGEWIRIRNYGPTSQWGGEFSAVVPAARPVTISARSPFNTDDFLETWLGDTQDVAQAEAVTPDPGTSVAVGDIAVKGGETLEGTVEDKGGKPVPGLTVEAFRGRTDEVLGSATTDDVGAYAIPGLGTNATGQVTVRFSGERIATSWGKNRASQAEADLIGLASWNPGTQTVTYLPEYQVQTAPPTLTGSGLVGSTVTATPGTATPTPTDTEIWWYCGSTPLGVEGTQYLVTAADTGCALAARQLSVLEGHGTGVATSPPVIVKRFEVLDQPAVYGARVVGTRLRITNLKWSAAPDTIAYQWLRSGKPISGATGSTYVPTIADIGDKVSVRIIGGRTAESISTTRHIDGSPIVRAKTALRIVSVVSHRGYAEVAVRFTSPGVTRPGGYIRVTRREADGGESSVTRLRVPGSPQTIRFTYRSPHRANRLIFTFAGTTYAAPARTTAAVYVR